MSESVGSPARQENADYRLAAAGREAEERAGLQDVHDEASRSEVEVMTAGLADPSVWLHREVLHACRGRRPLASS